MVSSLSPCKFQLRTTVTNQDVGEIDIIESTNTVPNNLMALHTSATPNCSVAGAGQMGTLLTDNCAVSHHTCFSLSCSS